MSRDERLGGLALGFSWSIPWPTGFGVKCLECCVGFRGQCLGFWISGHRDLYVTSILGNTSLRNLYKCIRVYVCVYLYRHRYIYIYTHLSSQGF